MDQPILVSIIIPVYNVKQYLQKCFQSVASQTYNNIEIILIDDGSTDGSGDLCEKLAKSDIRTKVIHQSNAGLSQARNTGIELSQGNWITFVDSDDIVSPSLIEILLNSALSNNAEIAICDVEHTSDQTISDKVELHQISTLTTQEAIESLLYQTSFLPSACGKLFYKSIFDEVLFPKGKIFEDIAIMGKLFEKANTIVYLQAKLYGYVHRDNSITTKRFSQQDCYILDICDDYCKRYQNNPLLFHAAIAYKVNCSLRIWLNAPTTDEYSTIREQCEITIRSYGQSVIRDKKIRRKLRIGLLLFLLCRPLIRTIYARVDRWK